MHFHTVYTIFASVIASNTILLCTDYTAKNVQVETSLFLQQLFTTSQYQDAFTWLATAGDNKSVASCQQACCKLIISTGLLQLVSKSCSKSANDKLQQT